MTQNSYDDPEFFAGDRVRDWLAKGVVKQHRTLGTYLNLLISLGFTIAHVENGVRAMRRSWPTRRSPRSAHPMFLLVGARV